MRNHSNCCERSADVQRAGDRDGFRRNSKTATLLVSTTAPHNRGESTSACALARRGDKSDRRSTRMRGAVVRSLASAKLARPAEWQVDAQPSGIASLARAVCCDGRNGLRWRQHGRRRGGGGGGGGQTNPGTHGRNLYRNDHRCVGRDDRGWDNSADGAVRGKTYSRQLFATSLQVQNVRLLPIRSAKPPHSRPALYVPAHYIPARYIPAGFGSSRSNLATCTFLARPIFDKIQMPQKFGSISYQVRPWRAETGCA